jgi:acetylglutamate kinase
MELSIVKIGGHVLDSISATKDFLDTFSALKGPRILVHGGGKKATQLATTLNIESPMIDGRRVTSKEMLELVTMVYSGISKMLVGQLYSYGLKAIGLSGADMSMIPASKRPAAPIDFGYVGDIDPNDINTSDLINLLNSGTIPVFAALTQDKETGGLLNTNADTIAQSLAVALSESAKVHLIYAFEKAGVQRDINDADSVIHMINKNNHQSLIDQKIITDGMLPKLHNAISAIESGVEDVRITSYTALDKGTLISL